MGAGSKLEKLKRAWIVYAVFAAAIETARDGLDSHALVSAAIRIGATVAFAWFLTRQLTDKSSLVWAIGVVFGLIGGITDGIVMVQTIVDLTEGRGFALATFLLASGSFYIHIRTFRVLRDPEVKRFVMLD